MYAVDVDLLPRESVVVISRKFASDAFPVLRHIIIDGFARKRKRTAFEKFRGSWVQESDKRRRTSDFSILTEE